MSEPQELSAQAFWRADFASAALSVHQSASKDLRVRLSNAATLLRWAIITLSALQALIIMNALGVIGEQGGLGDVTVLGVELALSRFPQSLITLTSLLLMGAYLLRALDDEASHRAQTRTLEFVGKNLLERMRYEEWSQQIISAAMNDRSIFLARCAGVVREFCREPGVGNEDFDVVRQALHAEAREPHPTLDTLSALDFTGHPQLKTLLAGKHREFKDYVATTKRRLAESFVDLENDGEFKRLASQGDEEGKETEARRKRYSRAMRHFVWLDEARDAIDEATPSFQLDGMKAFLIHDPFLERLAEHFEKARRLFAWTNTAFVSGWLVINVAHIAAIAAHRPALV